MSAQTSTHCQCLCDQTPSPEELTQQLDGLNLFKSLIKDGCKWQGDVNTCQRSEFLHIPADARPAALSTLESYKEGTIYRLDEKLGGV